MKFIRLKAILKQKSKVYQYTKWKIFYLKYLYLVKQNFKKKLTK